MISVIVCSLSDHLFMELEKNIMETIGCRYEILRHDNRKGNRPIAEIYNSLARLAKYEFLLFVHEDVRFLSRNWGLPIAAKLAEKDCGTIGFAGSSVKTRNISGWCPFMPKYESQNYYYESNGQISHCSIGSSGDFTRVITLDGMALCVRKDVWEKYPFDEKRLTGFHCYDLDFSMTTSFHYKNYVCHCISILHKSKGNFTQNWLDETIHMHKVKWDKYLPLYISKPSPEEMTRMEDNVLWWTIKKARCISSPQLNNLLIAYKKLPASFAHTIRYLKLIFFRQDI